MTEHTNAEQEHRTGPTALADAELDQVCGGAAARLDFDGDRVPDLIFTRRGVATPDPTPRLQ